MTLVDRIARLGDRSARLARAIIPDPFVIAILLSVVTLVGGYAVAAGRPDRAEIDLMGLISSYAGGMFESNSPTKGLVAFAFKMALILVTGHALAAAGPVRYALAVFAGMPRTTGGAAAMVAVVAMILGLINWGVGLVGGAFLAREVGRSFAQRGQSLNYPLVGAAGYMGLLVWHGGLSGSAPLAVATDGSFGMALNVTDTIFSGLNVVVSLVLLLAIALLFWALGKGSVDAGREIPTDPRLLELGSESPSKPSSQSNEAAETSRFVFWLENSVWVGAVFVLPVLIALGYWLAEKGTGAVNLDSVILTFWMAGMVLHRTPMAYMAAFGEGVKSSAGILLQFPLYFGILAVARDSGLLEVTARSMASFAKDIDSVVSASVTAPIFTFVTSGLVNLFVPSGGGQWALQSPIILETSNALGLDRAKMLMAFAYGDEITNMLQPFWALPLLSITGLRAREIMGYTILAMLTAAPIFIIALAIS